MAEEQAWVRIQRKTFTRWCNNYLLQRNIAIESLEKDLSDGIPLHGLLEILGGERVDPQPKKNARLKLQKVENINICLRYIKSKDIKLVGIGAEDIHDGKTSLILGLIWTLILRFQIVGQGEVVDSAKQALLDWCNRVLNPQGIQVTNFKSDWQDGKAFCGLVNALQENTIPLDSLSENAENSLNLAFIKAEELFSFPKVLDAIDVIENVDELSNMTYISYFRGFLTQNTACAAKCFAEGLGLTEAITHQPATFIVYACNEEGEKANRGGANVRCYLRDEKDHDQCKVQIIDNRNGSYTCTYLAPTPGQAVLHVQIGKDPIQGSPFHPRVDPGEPDPGHCVCHGPGIEGGVAGQPTEFFIQTKDCNGNNLPQGGAIIIASLADPSGDIPVSIVDNQDGTYTASYTPKAADDLKLRVIVKTEHFGEGNVQNSPFTVHISPGEASAKNTIAYGPGTEGAVAGTPSVITIQCKDEFGNNLDVGGAPLYSTLSVNGEDVTALSVIDNNDGTYNVEYFPEAAGNYVVAINLGAEPISNSPVNVTILPGPPDPLKFTWDGLELDAKGQRVVVAGETDHFEVTARDGFGNALQGGGLNVQGHVEGPEKVSVKTEDQGNGTYTLAYIPEKTGLYTFTVDVNKQKVGGSSNPFLFVVVPAGVSPENSLAYGPGVESAQIGRNNVFTVETRDRFDNPLTSGGAEVGGQLVVEGVHGFEPVPIVAVDNGDGTYQCSYPDLRVAGEYRLVPTVDGVPVKDSPFVLVVSPGDISVDNTEVIFPSLNVSGLEGPTITLRDELMNTRKTGGDHIVAEIRQKSRLPPVKARDKGDGTYEIDYPASLKGQYEAIVTVNDKEAPGGPWNIDVDENKIGEEHHAQAERLFPNASGALIRLLHGATESERERILKEIAALSSL